MRPSIQLLLFALMFGWCTSVSAQLPVIQLHSVSRSVFQPGDEAEIQVNGSSVEEVSEIRFSHPGISAELLQDPPRPFEQNPSPKYGHFRLKVAADVPVGRYELRALGRFGLSNPRSILVANQVRHVTTVGHDANSKATCELGVVYHRQVTPQRSDVYWVDVAPGQEIKLGLSSEAIDSRLRGSVTVSDETGRVIATMTGDSTGDLIRNLTIPPNVDRILVAIDDVLYRGGNQFGYALAVADAETALPLEPLVAPLHPRCLSARFETPQPIEETTDATRINLPALIESNFDSPTDEDEFICGLEKGQTVLISCFSDRLGEPTDSRIIIHRAIPKPDGTNDWQRVASGDDCQGVSDGVLNLNSRDTELSFTAPEKGDYRITVSDQDTGEFLSSRQRYVLHVGAAAKEPILVAYHLYPHRDPNLSRPSGIQLPRGGSAVIRVFAIRRGFAGSIDVSVPKLPTGVKCDPATIAAGRNQTDLVLSSAPDTPIANQAIDVIGAFTEGELSAEVTAIAAAVLWERNAQEPTIRTRTVDQLFVQTTELDTLPVTVGPASDQVLEVVKGNKLTVPLKLARHDGTKNNVIFRARNLPPGVKAGDLNVGGDKTEAQWTIDVTAGTPPGLFTFWSQAETKVKFAVNPQTLTRETEYLDKLKKLRADPARSAEHAELDKVIAETNKRIESIKKQTAPRDFTIFVATPVIKVNVKEK